MKKILAVLFVVIVLTALLLSCAGTPQTTIAPEQKATALFSDFQSQKVCAVTGVVQKGEEKKEIYAVVDAENNAAYLSVDGVSTVYYAKTTFRQKDDGYEVVSVSDNFRTFLKNLPYSAYFFSFDKDDCESAHLTGSHLVVTFGGAGVKRCFSSDENVSGGVFTAAFSGDSILSTVLTTELTVGNQTQTLYARYAYSYAGSVDTDLTITPSDGVPYAVYAIKKLVAANSDKTLCLADSGKDTDTTLDAILPTATSEYITLDDLKSAYAIDSNEYVTLHVEYDGAKTVIGLSSSVREIDLTYRKTDYVVTLIVINDGLRYVLQ